MKEGEPKPTGYISPLSHHLVGVDPGKRPPTNPYRPTGKDMDIHARLMRSSAKMGRIAEAGVFFVWTGEMDTWNKDMESIPGHFIRKPLSETKLVIQESMLEILPYLRQKYKRPNMEHPQLVELYEDFAKGGAEMFGDSWRPERKPVDDSLRSLFEAVDMIYDGHFLADKYTELMSSGTQDPSMRYLIETLLVLGKEAVDPLNVAISGELHSNVRATNGNLLCQFDGIIIPQSNELYTDFGLDMWDLLKSKTPWSIVETKVPFRARYLTGKRKIRRPFTWDKAQTQKQLGNLMLAWIKRGNKNIFTLPSMVEYVYLRGVLPHVTIFERIDSHYLANWILGLNEKKSDESISQEDRNDTELLTKILEKRRIQLKKKEEREWRKRKDKTIAFDEGEQEMLPDFGTKMQGPVLEE